MRFICFAVLAGLLVGCGDQDSAAGRTEQRVVVRMLRLSDVQYLNIVRDVFGAHVRVTTSFDEPALRQAGLLAAGAARRGMTPAVYAAAEAMAREVAAEVFAPGNRVMLRPCLANAQQAPDEACARGFIEEVGRLLFRRPLEAEEVERFLSVVETANAQTGDPLEGMQMGLVAMLVSPHFLFRMEIAEPDPDAKGRYRLTPLSKASRLSFLFWNTAPDAHLLAVAESGGLDTKRGLAREIDRLMSSPRLEDGLRAFFYDLLHLDGFKSFSKDPDLFPNFTPQATLDAPEQMLRTIVNHLVYEQGDYRDLLTTRKTYLTPSLAALLKVPLAQARPNGAAEQWSEYEFPPGDPRAGLLAQPAFVALHTHPGRTSPTLRGKAVREMLLCQEVPPPPANVEFNIVQDDSGANKTMRERLLAHSTEPACAGCHKITDSIGLTLENFDSAGAFRTKENGLPIDTSGVIDGVPIEDMQDLTAALRDNPALTACAAQRVYNYGTGRTITRYDRRRLKKLIEDFREDGNFLSLMRAVALSDEFYSEARK